MNLWQWFRNQFAVRPAGVTVDHPRPPRHPPVPDRIGPTDFEGAALLVATEMVKLLVERHRKYGPANIARHGERGCVVRMGDKLARLERAYDLTPTCWACGAPYGGDMAALDGAEFGDESLEDAWLDGGNYALVAMMVRRGWWHLPLRNEWAGYCPTRCTETHPHCHDMHRVGDTCVNYACGHSEPPAPAHPLRLDDD